MFSCSVEFNLKKNGFFVIIRNIFFANIDIKRYTKNIYDSLIPVVYFLFGSMKTIVPLETFPRQTSCIYFSVFELWKVFIIKPERRLMLS